MRSAHSSFLGMNTIVSQSVYGWNACKAAAAVRAEVRRLEALFSRFLSQSDIAVLNRSAGGPGVTISKDCFDALAVGQECARQTDGCFDMTVCPLVRLWAQGQPPDQALVLTRRLTGFADLSLDSRECAASLAKAGQSVDLGGIGKGYAADRMLWVLRRYHIKSALVNLGGNVAALGKKPDATPWMIAIRNPKHESSFVGTLSVSDCAVVTSGDDQRAVRDADGTARSHIIDPRTGMPAQSGLLSVTVVSASSAIADALATALFTAGTKDGLRYLKRYPGAQAIFIDRDLSVFLTSDLSGSFRAAEGIKAYPV